MEGRAARDGGLINALVHINTHGTQAAAADFPATNKAAYG
jgi:hypothetical protein